MDRSAEFTLDRVANSAGRICTKSALRSTVATDSRQRNHATAAPRTNADSHITLVQINAPHASRDPLRTAYPRIGVRPRPRWGVRPPCRAPPELGKQRLQRLDEMVDLRQLPACPMYQIRIVSDRDAPRRTETAMRFIPPGNVPRRCERELGRAANRLIMI